MKSSRNMKSKHPAVNSLSALVTGAALTAATASAATIYPVNGFSFEAPVTTTFVSTAPTGWTAAGTQFGYQNAAFASITGATDNQVAFANGQSSLWSAASLTTIALGETYTLTVDVAGRTGNATTASRLRFFADSPLSGGSIVAEYVFNPADNSTLVSYSLDYTPLASHAGKGLFVMLSNAADSGQTVFDNVRLTSVPEPASATMGVLGSLLLFRRRRTR